MNRLGALGFSIPTISDIGAGVAKQIQHAATCNAELAQIAELKKQRMMAGAGGLVVGAIVGYLLGKR